ncbi:MAG: hypothetical protein QOJ13_2400 [Gaiellales bacterium]|nr:hypothetical protein [Gaiellales bacterium]
MAIHYEITVVHPGGRRHAKPYASDEPLRPGDTIVIEGRDWVIENVEEPANGGDVGRATAKPARYRLRLRHPDGREELGAFRRFRPDRPQLGHAFTTLEDGRPISWEVVDERLAFDEQGEPFLDLVAERDYAEYEQLPDHELEHAMARRETGLPAGAVAMLGQAQQSGLQVELAALEPGEEPDWDEAGRFIDALILDEVEDDLLEMCGVDTRRSPRDTWLYTVKERLSSDLAQFRAGVENGNGPIEVWEFREGRIFASVGSMDDEFDPDHPHGWMCRLLDSSTLGAAGFERVRKAEMSQLEP